MLDKLQSRKKFFLLCCAGYFAKDVFLELHFCVTLQSIQNFFCPGTLSISSEALEKFQIYGVKITGRYSCEQKNWIFSFLLIPPSRRKLPISPELYFLKIFPPAERGEDHGAEKITKIKLARILVISFDKFQHLYSLYNFGSCFVVP